MKQSIIGKRIGWIFLFVLLLITLLFVKPMKAHAEEYINVNSISVTGLYEPAPETYVFDSNNLMQDTMKIETDQPGAIQTVDATWYNATSGIEQLLIQTDPTANAIKMKNTDRFLHNRPYVFKLSIQLKTGYKVLTDQYSVSVNGINDRTVKTSLNVKDHNGVYITTITIYKIYNTVGEHGEEDVLIRVPTQYVGDPIVSPSVSFSEYDVFTRVYVYDQNNTPVKMWVNDALLKFNGMSRDEFKVLVKEEMGLESTDVFEEGLLYEYDINVVKKNGELFSTLPKVSLNGTLMDPSMEMQNTVVTVGGSGEYVVKPKKPNSSAGFTDVVKGSFYEQAVNWAVANGVTTGTSKTTFSPMDECKRGQVVTFLWRAYGCPEPSLKTSPFVDVTDPGKYYYKAVLWAVENGVTTGTSKTTFSPEDTVTRGQFVTFLHRAQGNPPASGTNKFTDVEPGKFYYKPVCWAAANGVTTGTSPTTFSPNDSCTRAQVVTFIYRALK